MFINKKKILKILKKINFKLAGEESYCCSLMLKSALYSNIWVDDVTLVFALQY